MLVNRLVVGVYPSEMLYYKHLGKIQILDHLSDYKFPGAPNSEFMYTYLQYPRTHWFGLLV